MNYIFLVMSYGGHVNDMINRLRENRELLKLHRERYRELRDMYYHADDDGSHRNTARKKLTKKEYAALKKELKRLERRELIVKILALTIAVVTTVGGLYLLLFS